MSDFMYDGSLPAWYNADGEYTGEWNWGDE